MRANDCPISQDPLENAARDLKEKIAVEAPSIRNRLTEATKRAEANQDSTRLCMLRLINAAVRDRDLAERSRRCLCDGDAKAPDATILSLLSTMIHQRENSAENYEESGRLDLAERERAEIAVVREFLPEPLSEAESRAAVNQAIAEMGARNLRDLGRVMSWLKARYPGQMDFNRACGWVKDSLT